PRGRRPERGGGTPGGARLPRDATSRDPGQRAARGARGAGRALAGLARGPPTPDRRDPLRLTILGARPLLAPFGRCGPTRPGPPRRRRRRRGWAPSDATAGVAPAPPPGALAAASGRGPRHGRRSRWWRRSPPRRPGNRSGAATPLARQRSQRPHGVVSSSP